MAIMGPREDTKPQLHVHQTTTGQHELYELEPYLLDKWLHLQETISPQLDELGQTQNVYIIPNVHIILFLHTPLMA